jgi:hypothetical protein
VVHCEPESFRGATGATATSFPLGIAPGPDGNLWFTEASGNQTGRITPVGTITEFPVPTAGSRSPRLSAAALGRPSPPIGQRARLSPTGTRRWQVGSTEARRLVPAEAVPALAGVLFFRRFRTPTPEVARHQGVVGLSSPADRPGDASPLHLHAARS